MENIMKSTKQKSNGISWFALASFLASVIGAGFFGLPFVGAQAGFLSLLIAFLILTPVVIVIHLRLADVALGTKGHDRIPGYVGKYLGAPWKKFSLTLSLLGFLGSTLAYLILGASFIHLLFGSFIPLRPITALFLFVAFGVFLIARGAKSVAKLDLILMAIFFVIALIFLIFALQRFVPSYLSSLTPTKLPLTYGIIIFSLWALPLVPEIAEFTKRDRRHVRWVVAGGIAISAIVYLLFTFSVLGVTGPNTTEDALTGFVAMGGRWLGIGAAIFGLIAVFTSYITQSVTFEETLSYDAKLPRNAAFTVAVLGPLALFFLGFQNFIEIIGVTGSVLLGLEGTLVLITAEAFRRRQRTETRAFHWTSALLIALLLVGVVFDLWFFISRRLG